MSLVALLCICSCIYTSFLRCGFHACIQYSKWGLTIALYRGIIKLFSLYVIFLRIICDGLAMCMECLLRSHTKRHVVWWALHWNAHSRPSVSPLQRYLQTWHESGGNRHNDMGGSRRWSWALEISGLVKAGMRRGEEKRSVREAEKREKRKQKSSHPAHPPQLTIFICHKCGDCRVRIRLLFKSTCIEFKYYSDVIHSGLTPPG